MEHVWTCACCGQQFKTLPLNFVYDKPHYWSGLTDATVSKLNSDFCSIDNRHFFVRGRIEIPIIGYSDVLAWGVWTLLSKESFRRAVQLCDTDPDEDESPRFGWLSNNIEGYPPTLNHQTNVYFQGRMLRPKFVLEPTDHPLAVEQRNGITIERVQEIAALQHQRYNRIRNPRGQRRERPATDPIHQRGSRPHFKRRQAMSESSGSSQSEITSKDMIGPRLRLSLVRAAAAGLPKGKLVDAVRELGILSDTQEAEISQKIMHAVLSYWLRLHQEGCVLWSPRPTLITVARTGSALLSLLGVGPRRLSQEPEELERIMFAAPHPDLIREVLRVADGYEADNAEGATYVIQRYATIVRSVAVLVEAARRCVASLSAAETPHSRHRVSPSPESDLLQAIESDLLQAIISTYATAHELSTDAVRRLGYSKDGPLERFVRACLSVAEPGLGERITSGVIEGQFRRWKAKATPDQTPAVHSSRTPKHSAPRAIDHPVRTEEKTRDA